MSFILNEFEVETIAERLRGPDGVDVPNLAAGAATLARLVEWTNDNSDGWPYWRKPSAASAKLQTALANRVPVFGGFDVATPDVTERELKTWLAPIKAFLTRQGVEHSAIIVNPEV